MQNKKTTINLSEAEFSKFSKIMMLSTSDNDNEALAALRTANKFLSVRKLNWDDLLKSGCTIIQEVVPNSRNTNTRTKLDYCLKHCGRKDSTFLQSLDEQFQYWGTLTVKQQSALEKVFQRYL